MYVYWIIFFLILYFTFCRPDINYKHHVEQYYKQVRADLTNNSLFTIFFCSTLSGCVINASSPVYWPSVDYSNTADTA